MTRHTIHKSRYGKILCCGVDLEISGWKHNKQWKTVNCLKCLIRGGKWREGR